MSAASKKEKIKGLLNKAANISETNISKNEIIDSINTGIQKNVTKKKATFELDTDLHTKLKIFAAKKGEKMVDIVEKALYEYLTKEE